MVQVKKTVSKYDVDCSGELERVEVVRALSELLPGVRRDRVLEKHTHTSALTTAPAAYLPTQVGDAELERLIEEFDTDDSKTISVDELTAFFVRTELDRAPTGTTLQFSKKPPLYTKQGARGLA